MAGMMDMMWRVTVIDVEKCLTAVCSMVLKDESLALEQRMLRAEGLVNLGQCYMATADADGGKEARLERFKTAMMSMAEGGMPFVDEDEPPAWDPDGELIRVLD
eukprot:SAG22_NODE_3918_length_1468_cov_1.471877_1_plen_104_part_00